jgi:hypothetical protein
VRARCAELNQLAQISFVHRRQEIAQLIEHEIRLLLGFILRELKRLLRMTLPDQRRAERVRELREGLVTDCCPETA